MGPPEGGVAAHFEGLVEDGRRRREEEGGQHRHAHDGMGAENMPRAGRDQGDEEWAQQERDAIHEAAPADAVWA